jgi:enoyl-CoA hydratase/carnithine racemase
MGREGTVVLYEVREGVAIITLNRPALHNSLTVESLRLLAEHSRAAQADAAVRAIVITGAGDEAFCTGGDLAELMPRIAGEEGLDLIVPDATKRFFSDVFKPVIAAINGLTVGGGFEIMLGTDLRVASSAALFGLGEVRWGHIPGGGSHVRLPAQIPYAIAMQLILTARPIDAQRAYEVGLINEVVEPGQVLERALALAGLIARNAPLAVQTAKEIAVRALGHERGFQLERVLNERVASSEDAREGPAAFTEKRPPRYTGR